MFTLPPFPAPNTSLGAQAAANSIRTAMENGSIRQRRRFSTDRITTSVTWTLTDLELGIFAAFHKHRLNLGNDWFQMDLPLSGGGLLPHTVRFVDGKFNQSIASGVGYWDVSAQLEIQERVVFTEEVLDFYLQVGFSASDIQNLLADVANFHQFLTVTYPPLTT